LRPDYTPGSQVLSYPFPEHVCAQATYFLRKIQKDVTRSEGQNYITYITVLTSAPIFTVVFASCLWSGWTRQYCGVSNCVVFPHTSYCRSSRPMAVSIELLRHPLLSRKDLLTFNVRRPTIKSSSLATPCSKGQRTSLKASRSKPLCRNVRAAPTGLQPMLHIAHIEFRLHPAPGCSEQRLLGLEHGRCPTTSA
jgi:hypothetical protein